MSMVEGTSRRKVRGRPKGERSNISSYKRRFIERRKYLLGRQRQRRTRIQP